jgi:hypothetical protein
MTTLTIPGNVSLPALAGALAAANLTIDGKPLKNGSWIVREIRGTAQGNLNIVRFPRHHGQIKRARLPEPPAA